MELKPDFRLTSVSKPVQHQLADPYDPIDVLLGTWKGHGFNQIWRPFFGGPPGQDRFLELNETNETLEFEKIPGEIPNRGLLQADINLHGIRYLQAIQDAHALGPNGQQNPGIHIENGMWLTVPADNTANPPKTIARMGSIPHGTSILAQGTKLGVIAGPPPFAVADITPFAIGNPGGLVPFPESKLAIPTAFRTSLADIPNVTQAMVDNPNTGLANAIAGLNITSTTTFKISTIPLNPPPSGGGTSNISFLQGAAGGPNAQSVEIDAIFWIETVTNPDGTKKTLLQYSQRVLLNFNGLSWPHISVATLEKQPG